MFNFFNGNEKKVDQTVDEIILFLEELKIKYQPQAFDEFIKSLYEDNGEAKGMSSISFFYPLAWFIMNRPSQDDYSILSKNQKLATGVTEYLGKESFGPNPFSYNEDIILNEKKINYIFKIESKVIINLLKKVFYESNQDLIKPSIELYYENIDHKFFSTVAGGNLDNIYKYFYQSKDDTSLEIKFFFDATKIR